MKHWSEWCAVVEILGSIKLSDEVLNTTMYLVGNSLNHCPLTPVLGDPDSLEASTLNHFPKGQHSLTFPSLRSSENYSHSIRYAPGQSYANATWQQWLREFFPTLI